MKLVDHDDVEIMIALYCSLRNVGPVELFAELADVESVQNVTPLNQHSDSYTKVLRAYVHRRSPVHGGPDLNEVPNDIDDDNLYAPLLGNPTHSIVIQEFSVGHQFASKEERVFAIKWYNMKISVDNKVIVDNLDAKNEIETIRADGGETRLLRGGDSPLNVKRVSRLGPTELISETGSAIARGSRLFVPHLAGCLNMGNASTYIRVAPRPGAT
ncbi:hypothetical protein GOBAR_DD15322 [Gossypium barbadense]|nr:hypothetical protein GOBAR_DD15322 [Gossypium barbadense]